jgi:hypothetical protein
METFMTTIKAIVRNGRIEVDEPINLPDGTELTIPIPDLASNLGSEDIEESDTPEAIEAWIRWYDSLEPLEISTAEGAAWEVTRQEDKQSELAHWEMRSKQIEGHFQ